MIQEIIFIIAANFFALLGLSYLFVGKGSDHHFYNFYINSIKKNGNRFFSIFPNFANETYITTPQFFCWLLSFFPKGKMNLVSLLLNPLLITLIGVITAIFLKKEIGFDFHLISLIIIITFITPQFFYGQNARIYGLNSRGIGLLLIVVFLFCGYYVMFTPHFLVGFIIAVLTGYLIWGTSLFAQQALVFYSVICTIAFGWYPLLMILICSIILFLVLHPNYAKAFFISRWRYLKIYNGVLAEKFILKARFSLWRDFVNDFWSLKNRPFKKHLLYIYNNGVFAVIILCPGLLFCIYLFIFDPKSMNTPLFNYSEKVIIGGSIIFILTSFRFSRILGEPERYIEMIIPFINFLAVPVIFNKYGTGGIAFLISYYVLVNFIQVTVFSFFLNKIADSHTNTFKNVIATIENGNSNKISFFCNNLNWSYYFLNTRWNFVHLYPTTFFLANIAVKDIMDDYPYINEKYINQIQNYYDVDFVLIDKKKWPSEHFKLDQMKILKQNDEYILFKKKSNEYP